MSINSDINLLIKKIIQDEQTIAHEKLQLFTQKDGP